MLMQDQYPILNGFHKIAVGLVIMKTSMVWLLTDMAAIARGDLK